MQRPRQSPVPGEPGTYGVFAAAREGPRMHTDIHMDAGLAPDERSR